MKIDLEKIRQTARFDLLAKQLVEGFITGLHKSPYHGFSVEFAEHKSYNAGESTKNIDWKVFARTDKLFTKRYEEETNLRCSILIDNSSSMYYPTHNLGKITFSILCAASLAYLLQKQRDAVGITTFSDEVEYQSQIKSTSSHLHKLFIHLEKMLQENQLNKRTSIPNVLHTIARKIHKRSLVIIFSDMFDNIDNVSELLTALHHLKHNHHEVLLVHVTDKSTEKEFNFEDRPYEFIDLETGDKIKVNPYEVKSNYVKDLRTFYHDIKLKCNQFKIDFIEADIVEDFDKVLTSFLIKRSKLN